ncbi:UDP-Glycosyltransferase superfamily protein [Striga asiatica]|uniref:Glycosyltransferase n=1 Tax=Striga asiatica TaxID=4170 RepID=A0A5A7PUV0_STRAF|nr:UDP-Glycosyltransferase superfamily protein [Striga asiatica]
MGSASENRTQKVPHAICVPFPAQGHINPMLRLAILLHHKGVRITFVHTHYNLTRLHQSHGPLPSHPTFRFVSIPEGLPTQPENAANSTQDIRSLCLSTRDNCLAPLNELIHNLNSDVPPVTCVIADTAMDFALDAAERVGVPCVMLQTASAVSLMCNKYVVHLVEKGIIPLKDPIENPVDVADKSCLENGYLETPIDWIPGVIPLRLKHFSSTIQTTDPKDPMLDFVITAYAQSSKAAAIVINTIDALEQNVLASLSSICPQIHTVGSLHLLLDQLPADNALKSVGLSLWKEDRACLDWLGSQPENSVVYVNFGSITVLDPKQLSEFAWGLAGSGKSFLWIVRPDLVRGEAAALPPEFWAEVGNRGFVAGWAPQEEVLRHPAVGGFLTHCGWNSIVESLCSGVPMLCWPFFADQKLNCRYTCEVWGVGMEIGDDVRRDEVGFLVRELLGGDRGKMMREKAAEWREKAAAAVAAGGSSSRNLERLISEILTI